MLWLWVLLLTSPKKELLQFIYISECHYLFDQGEMSHVKGMKDLFLHTYSNDFMVAVAVENKVNMIISQFSLMKI